MAIFKSIFWLAFAFIVLGPQVDWDHKAQQTTDLVLESSANIAQEQIQAISCADLICEGQKSLAVLSIEKGMKSQQREALTETLVAPIPLPRMERN